LATTAPLFLLLFATSYFLMTQADADSFSAHPLTRTDTLYFTVTVFATVGFGDISPASQAARLLVMLGPGDVPARSEHLRLAGRAAAAAGGWGKLRGHLDALDLSSPDARRALRAAVGAMQPKALLSRRAYNALRARFPRLPEPEVVGVGEQRKRAAGEEGAAAPRRRRRRRRLRATTGPDGAPPQSGEAQGQPERREGEAPAEGAAAPTTRRRRRRRRRPRSAAGAETAAARPDAPPPEPAGA